MKSKRCSHNLQSSQQGSCQRTCVLIMRITSKIIDQRFWEGTKNMTVQGRTVSHYYILVIRKFIDFMSLFRHSVWFSFSVKQFPSAEFGIWFATYSCVYLIRTAEELSYRAVFCCKPYRKVKVSSRNRAFSSSCDLFITIALNFNVEFKELTNRNKRSETLWRVMFVQVFMICTAVSSYL